jgi:hypothetical protein
MRRGTPRRSEQNQLLDEEIGKIPEQLPGNNDPGPGIAAPYRSSYVEFKVSSIEFLIGV